MTDEVAEPVGLASAFNHPVRWFRSLHLIWKVTVCAVAVLVVVGLVWPESGPSQADRARYEADRSFCEGRATERARATEGLHSVGGAWWVDQVNDCLLARD